MQTSSHNPSRRSFLKQSSLAAGFSILPSYLTAARPDGAPLPPSGRINLACVGIGGRASKVISALCRNGMAKPVAFCDVDFELAPGAKAILERYPDVPRFHDFREMYDKMGDDFDAVSIATPDHSHFCATILAMAMGKHVYVEKPLTRTFEESEILMRAEKKFGVVTQMGNQGHTSEGIEQFERMVELGLCDNMTTMHAWKSPSLWFMKQDQRISLPLVGASIPPSLSSWDLWCGPRQMLPYHELYHPFNWRGFYEYGMGMLGDWGPHIIDFVHDKLELGLPSRISALEMGDHNQTFYPLTTHLSMHFPARGPKRPAMDLTWKDGPDCRPDVPEPFWDTAKDGTPKTPHLPGGGSILYGADNAHAIVRGHHAEPSRLIPREKHIAYYEELKTGKLDKGGGRHFQSFIEACKGEGSVNSPFHISGTLTQVLALGTIAQYLNTELHFDPVAKQFIGNDDANALLAPPARKGWDDYYKLA